MSLLNPNLQGFFETPNIRTYVLYGGRASSKTYHTAGFCIFLAMNYRVKFLCVRQFQNRTSDSVKTVLEECIYASGVGDQFKITETEIEHLSTGSSFRFLGIQRNLKEIKGIAGIDVLWIEEAEDLTKDQWDTLEPTIRSDSSRVFIVFNPRYATDYVFRTFVMSPPEKTLVRKINYDENPFLSQTMLDVIERSKKDDEDTYRHIYLGQPLAADDAAVIRYDWIEAAIDAHIKLGIDLGGKRNVGYDVADSGADKNAAVTFDGAICLDIDEWAATEDALNQSTKRAWAHVQGGTMVYDSIGVGAHVGSTLDDMGIKTGFMKFNAGGAVVDPEKLYTVGIKNKDKFENVKAQAWQDVADRLRNTFNAVTKGETFEPSELISISSTCRGLDQLKIELSTPRKRYSKRGLDMVETKDELKARKIASPNKADGFIMGACPHLATGRRMGAFDF